MRAHTVDYRREGGSHSSAVHRGFWLYDLPRLIPLCRLLGHRPVVDGYDRARWVACDRCGVRPEPQGKLDPEQWPLGQRYTGAFSERPAVPELVLLKDIREYSPGPWPARPTGSVGGELVAGTREFRVGAGLKIGNAGSEHLLAGHVDLRPLGTLYLHTERHGQALQRRLNPAGYDSRVVELSLDHRRLSWQLWAKRDTWSASDPRWMAGSVVVDPRVLLFGEVRRNYANVGAPEAAQVRMPHGDDHQVTLQLQRVHVARTRGSRGREHWSVDWSTRPGIATEPGDHGHILGSSVRVSDSAVRHGTWVMAAAAAIAADMTASRTRYGYRSATVTAGQSRG